MRHPLFTVLISFFAASFALAQTSAALPRSKPEFILLGSAHDMHMKPEMHYTLIDLRHQIEALKPDLICVEIEPEAFDSQMEGYFPPEAAYIAAIAPELNVRVLPTDWRIAKAWQDRAEKQTPQAMKHRVTAMQEQIRKDLLAAVAQPSIYDFFHGKFQHLADKQFTQVIGENNAADIAGGAWHERNRRIVENALEAIGGARRILFVYGAAHLPQIARELADRGFSSNLAPRLFKPSGIQPLSPTVLTRWRRNLENLRAIRNGHLKVTRDSIEKVIDSNRIANLEEALTVYGEKSKS